MKLFCTNILYFNFFIAIFYAHSSISIVCSDHYNGFQSNRFYFDSIVNLNLRVQKNESYRTLAKYLANPAIAQNDSLAVNEPFRRLAADKAKLEYVAKLPFEDFKELNEKTIKLLEEYRPIPSNPRKKTSISLELANALLESFNDHPVVGNFVEPSKYDPVLARNICFGKAMYLHEMLLRIGVDKNSIFKIWVVGTMSSSIKKTENWDYHVATVVRLDSDEWVVIDPVYLHPKTKKPVLTSPLEWTRRYTANRIENKLWIFISDPKKFGPSSGKYSVENLELNKALENKVHNKLFYFGYFKDLQKWFKSMRDDCSVNKFLKMNLFPNCS